jgi:hypothetical protein
MPTQPTRSPRLILIALCALLGGASFANAQTPPRPGVAGTLPVASKASLNDQTARPYVFADPNWYHWGSTPVLGDDGKYHLFYDRWPRTNGRLMSGWLYVSQIAHATAAQPQGPYTFQDIALQGPGDKPAGRWDATNAHNAYCVRLPDPDAGGKLRYFLYYISNRDTNNMFNDWYDHIVNQRIGVAVADSPNGPWTRSTQPACSPASPMLGYIVNPGVTRLPDGRYLMLLKGRAATQPTTATSDVMGHYRIGWATATRPTGPFTIQPTLLYDTSGATVEDPCVFVWNGNVYAAVKDSTGQISGTTGVSWIYGTFNTDSTITWTIPPSASISSRILTWSDGSTTTLSNLERPFILQDMTGKPTHLFAAAAVSAPIGSQVPQDPPPAVAGSTLPFNVCIPLNP